MSTGGFLTGPTKLPGPQPVIIQNNFAAPTTFTLRPVATVAVGHYCLPTSEPVPWFHVAETVTVPAGATAHVPVHVTGSHAGTDVAIAVKPVAAPGTGVAVTYTSYAQEIIGGTTASGCAHIRGVAATITPSPLPVGPIAGGAGGAAVLAVAVAVWRVRRRLARPVPAHRRTTLKGAHTR